MMTDCYLTLDLDRTERFEQKLQQMINQGGLCLMVSIGHRTGLFDVMSNMDSASSREISDRAGLRERYVRDWLAAMVTGSIVEYDEMFKTYRLPSEYDSLLTRHAGCKNYATNVQWFSIFGKLEEDIIKCFREGGSVPESVFTDLQSKLAAEKSESDLNGLFKYMLPLVPTLIMQLCEGLDVLDLGCGTGETLLELAQAFPKSRFVGYDQSLESIEKARCSAEERGIENVAFFNRDLAQIHAIDAFDLVTAFDVMHDQPYPFQVLDEVYAALRPEGIFLMQDLVNSNKAALNLQNPLAPLLYSISCLRGMAASLQQNDQTDEVVWGQEPTCQTLEAVGFEKIEIHDLPHDILSEFYVATKPNSSEQ
ncbi:Trans-aconitate 2-methyltransferase [Gimesia alba]|uniref:Trans-aconitate 2-methyltransferase n=1 Tax=Gimesia alba TaxID=2527973 RepID=A0A517RN11_9PLAN|nr:class I SAM-dependent methyltransferase [Gimesia alba]QDT45267.1 Trans-aconitate 2-methyltransferase [Gimesia alba]